MTLADSAPIPPSERTITLFVPCYVDRTQPSAGIAAVELLEALGHSVEVRLQAFCCGQPFTNSGCADEGAEATRIWYEQMSGASQVVVLSSSCTVHLRHQRPSAWPSSLVVEEFCEFLGRAHPEQQWGTYPRRVCLHSSCHGIRDSGANAATLKLLEQVGQLEMVQTHRNDECCGFGGGFSVTYPELSVKMGRDRLHEMTELEIDEVVATDVSCLLHLHGIATASGLQWKFRHVAELLRDAFLAEVVTPGSAGESR